MKLNYYSRKHSLLSPPPHRSATIAPAQTARRLGPSSPLFRHYPHPHPHHPATSAPPTPSCSQAHTSSGGTSRTHPSLHSPLSPTRTPRAPSPPCPNHLREKPPPYILPAPVMSSRKNNVLKHMGTYIDVNPDMICTKEQVVGGLQQDPILRAVQLFK